MHRNVWHSEYRCLMNGTHDNFQYTQNAPNDPTAQPDGGFIGADLRDRTRFCLWCQELVTLRILERTDQLNASDDPANFVEKGERWYEWWATELRDPYWQLFDVSQQIVAQESAYAGMNVGRNGEALETSDLCSAFREDTPTVAGPSNAGVDEWLVLLG